MLGLIGYMKLLPVAVIVIMLAFAGHKLVVNKLESRIAAQEATIQQMTNQVSAYQAAEAENLQTISGLEGELELRTIRITQLDEKNDALQNEKDEYLSVFRRHDLQRLALAKPGLIEPIINNGTKEVFTQIETDSANTR